MFWIAVPPPIRKPDWRYKHMRLLAVPPKQRIPGDPTGQRELPVQIGDVVKVYMRRRAEETAHVCSISDVSTWGNVRVLEVEWDCPHCGHPHHIMIPESWVAEGDAVFVEKDKSPDGENA